jgi:hypothetical protein
MMVHGSLANTIFFGAGNIPEKSCVSERSFHVGQKRNAVI